MGTRDRAPAEYDPPRSFHRLEVAADVLLLLECALVCVTIVAVLLPERELAFRWAVILLLCAQARDRVEKRAERIYITNSPEYLEVRRYVEAS